MCLGVSGTKLMAYEKAHLHKKNPSKKKKKLDQEDKLKKGEDGHTDSCVHSANNELSVSEDWPVTHPSHTTRGHCADTLQPEQNQATGFSLAISEYVSVNREPIPVNSLSSKAIKYLHKKRLDERGYRMSNKKLGEGGFGAVYKVYAKDHSLPLACKIMILSKESNAKKDHNSMLQAFSNEVYVMKSCAHPNIVSIKQNFIYSHGPSTEDIRMVHSYIVMEFASLGTLYAKLKKQGPFGEFASQFYFRQLTSGLVHMHRRGIAHRDLKLGNILLTVADGAERVKLTDFGLSRLVHSRQSGLTKLSKPAGTLSYMSPELIECYVQYNSGQKELIRPYDCFGTDMWALGVCLFLMLSKVHPFDSPPSDKAERVEFARGMLIKQRARDWQVPPEVCVATSASCLRLLRELLEPKRRHRLNIYRVLQHQWLAAQIPAPVALPKTAD